MPTAHERGYRRPINIDNPAVQAAVQQVEQATGQPVDLNSDSAKLAIQQVLAGQGATTQPATQDDLASMVASKIASGGNSFQQQQGTQSSDYASQGLTTQQQSNQSLANTATTSDQTSNVATTGSQQQNLSENLSQGTTQSQQSTQGQTGTTTTGVQDTLGLSGLVASDVANAAQNEAARSGFLTDLVSNGPSGLNANVEAAINQAVSGPGMSGVGNEALSRVAGTAAADVARNATAQQLEAASQLAGPTASSSVVASGTPLLSTTQDTSQQIVSNALNATQQDQTRNVGSTTTTDNTQVGNVSNVGTQQTAQSGLANLVNQQNESGTTNAAFSQLGAALQPEGGSSGGLTVICSALNELGLISDEARRAEIAYLNEHWEEWEQIVIGYRRWATPIANWLLKHYLVAKAITPLIEAAMEVTQGRGTPLSRFLAKPFIMISKYLGRNKSTQQIGGVYSWLFSHL